MRERLCFARIYRGKTIQAEVEFLDYGAQAFLLGGDRSHVGAAAVVDETGGAQVLSLPGHKEGELALLFAKALYEAVKEPVMVTAGIHYDKLGKEGILKVSALAEELIREGSGAAEQRARQKGTETEEGGNGHGDIYP